jgi:hypothetical protein
MFDSRSHVSIALLLAFASCAVSAAAERWETSRPAEWTAEDARQLLTASPWAREVRAGIARRLSEDELREAGQMGQPTGVGYDGVDPKGSGTRLPVKAADIFTQADSHSARTGVRDSVLRLRWESALPIRIAEMVAREVESPTSGADGYCIGVYGIPGAPLQGDPKKLGEPLKSEAVLRREGKKDVKPSRVEVFLQSDGWAVFYFFPISAEISQKDGAVEFAAHIGRIVVDQRFLLAQMLFQGKFEL